MQESNLKMTLTGKVATMENNEVNIRKYKSDDKPYLRHICKKTAWNYYKKNDNKRKCSSSRKSMQGFKGN